MKDKDITTRDAKRLEERFIDDGVVSRWSSNPISDTWVGKVRPKRAFSNQFGKRGCVSIDDAEIKERAAKRLADALKNQ